MVKFISIFLFLCIITSSFYGCNSSRTESEKELYLGKNLTVTVSEDEIIDADYLRKVLEDEANKDESVFYLWDSEELTKLIDYMSENDLIIAAGQYSFNQACNFEDGFFTLNNGEKQQVFKFIKKDTTVTETIELPEPIVAEWDNKTVTIEFECITNIKCDNYFGCNHFINGYAAFYDVGNVDTVDSDSPHDQDGWNFIDYNGNRIFETVYEIVSNFDDNGLAVAQKYDGSYVWLSKDGYEIGPANKEEFHEFYNKFKSWFYPVIADYPDGYTLWDMFEKDKICYSGNLYNGLVPVIKSEKYRRSPTNLCFVDKEFNTVIKTGLEVFPTETHNIFVSEGRIVVSYGEEQRIAVIKVTVENSINDEKEDVVPIIESPETFIQHYDDKVITIEYDKMTNIDGYSLNASDCYFINGYARFFDYGDVYAPIDGSEFGYCRNNFNYIDTDGNRLFDEGFSEATHFDENGIAVVQKHDDSYVFVNSNSEEIGSATSDDYTEWESKLQKYCPTKVSKDYKLTELYTEDSIVHKYGNNYNGLIPFENIISEGIDTNYTIGFADEDGNIVVEPIIDADAESYFISEDKMVVRYKNRLTIIKLTVPDISKGVSDITANVEKTQEKSGVDLTGTLEDGRTVTVKIEADDELKEIVESGKYTIIQSTMLN